MAEFIRVGSRRVNVNDVHGVDVNDDGTVSIDTKGACLTLSGDEATAFLDWLGTVTLNPAAKVTVPDLTGQTWDEAAAALSDAGLQASFSGDAAGVVTSQEPSIWTEVDAGSTVTVTLAVPAPPEPPPPEPPPEEPEEPHTRHHKRSHH
jgi:hypothetical protein